MISYYLTQSYDDLTGVQTPAAVDSVKLPKPKRPAAEADLTRQNLIDRVGKRVLAERMLGRGSRTQPIKLEDDAVPDIAEEARNPPSHGHTILSSKTVRMSQTNVPRPLPMKEDAQIVPEASRSSRPHPSEPVEPFTAPNGKSVLLRYPQVV